MPKLTKKEMIIISVAIIVVFFGTYNFFIASRAKSKYTPLDVKAKSRELGAFVADVTSKITKGQLSAADAYIVGRAETQWKLNPFYEKKSFRDWIMFKEPAKSGNDSKSGPTFIYSGYLNMDNKKIAIINSVEYKTGDPLDIEDYVLKQIYSDKVVIVNKKNGAKFDVLLQE
jgi:hypothetical protein